MAFAFNILDAAAIIVLIIGVWYIGYISLALLIFYISYMAVAASTKTAKKSTKKKEPIGSKKDRTAKQEPESNANKQKGAQGAKAQQKACPNCGNMAAAQDIYCSKCGHNFQEII